MIFGAVTFGTKRVIMAIPTLEAAIRYARETGVSG